MQHKALGQPLFGLRLLLRKCYKTKTTSSPLPIANCNNGWFQYFPTTICLILIVQANGAWHHPLYWSCTDEIQQTAPKDLKV